MSYKNSINNSHSIKVYLIVKLLVLKKQRPGFTVVGPWFFDKVTDATKAVKVWASLICPVILRTFVLCCKLYSLNSTIPTLFSDQFNLLHTNFSHLNRPRCNK
jgi:hypothetical protein